MPAFHGNSLTKMESLKDTIESLFSVKPQDIWLGGTPGFVGEDKSPDFLFVAISEDTENWYENKCIPRNYYFNYKKFETLGLWMDCYDYGIYMFKKKSPKEISDALSE